MAMASELMSSLMTNLNSDFMGSIFNSGATPAAAFGEEEDLVWWRRRPVDHLRHAVTLGVWLHLLALRFLTDIFPCVRPVPRYALTFPPLPPLDGTSAVPSSAAAVGRALAHMLGVVNEIPASSRKYEFMVAMADKVLSDNERHGGAKLLGVNRAALSTAFARTCDLLRRSLRRSESCPDTWQSRALRMLPAPAGPRLAACYDALRLCLSGLPGATPAASRYQRRLAMSSVSASAAGDWPEAEKLAQELLWIAGRLRACSGFGEVIVRWGFASGLASLSLAAHPRVQGVLVKITAVVFRELASGEWEAWEVPRQARFGVLANWLPLLCRTAGTAASAMVGTERWEVERTVVELVTSLSAEEQEVVLGLWVEDFAAS